MRNVRNCHGLRVRGPQEFSGAVKAHLAKQVEGCDAEGIASDRLELTNAQSDPSRHICGSHPWPMMVGEPLVQGIEMTSPTTCQRAGGGSRCQDECGEQLILDGAKELVEQRSRSLACQCLRRRPGPSTCMGEHLRIPL